MVWSVIKTVEKGLKFRGGWYGLLEHMYTVRNYAERLFCIMVLVNLMFSNQFPFRDLQFLIHCS